ncbi:MAG: hypothetical protein L3J47_00140 [Sulfurovum sp.]|nr:hypothetical protein [Sulfurovum sp.]
MTNLVILTLLSILASCVNAVPPFLYNTEDPDVAIALEEAVLIINEVSGCELVKSGPDEDFSATIVVRDEHTVGSTILGCAHYGAATDVSRDMYDIIISRWVIGSGRLVSGLVHEIVHTLGYEHDAVQGFVLSTGVPLTEGMTFSAESVRHLQDLCREVYE